MNNHTLSARETASRSTDTLPAPRSEAGIAKLRRRIAATAADNGGGAIGLGDPFAEVFAAMASVQSPAPTPVQPTGQPPPENKSSEAETDSDQPSSQSQSHSADDVVAAQLGPTNQDALSATTPVDESGEVEEPLAVNQIVRRDAEADSDASGENKYDGAEIDAKIDRDEQTDTPPVAIVQDQTPEAAIDTEVAVAAGLNRDSNSRHSDSLSAESDGGEISAEMVAPADIDAEPSRAKAAPSERASGPLEPHEQTSDGKQERSANSPVERRRYSDRSEQPTAQHETAKAEHRPGTNSSVAANPPSNDAESSSRLNMPTANNGIDISGMSATQAPSGLSAVAVAAATATRSVGGSAAAGSGARAPSAASVSGSNAGSQSSEAPSSFGLDPAGRSPRDGQAVTAKSSAGVDTTAAVERAKLAQRVSRGFQHLGSGGGQIRMRLSPDHLGSVQLQMTIQNGKLSGRMVTQSDAASQLLREQLPSLRATLESQGIRMERIDIETDSSSENASRSSDERQSDDTPSGFAGQQFAGQQHQAGGQHRSRSSAIHAARRNPTAAANQQAAVAAPIGSLPILPGSVDLHV